eukprot:gene333-3700_t
MGDCKGDARTTTPTGSAAKCTATAAAVSGCRGPQGEGRVAASVVTDDLSTDILEEERLLEMQAAVEQRKLEEQVICLRESIGSIVGLVSVLVLVFSTRPQNSSRADMFTDLLFMAREEYNTLVQQQRQARLMHLLEKSCLYTQFLSQRLRDQQEEELKCVRKSQNLKEQTPQSGNNKSLPDKTDKNLDDPTPKQSVLNAVSNFKQPKLVSGGILREYQLAGVDWLRALYENGLNGILADEMGLGKTVQTISLFAHLYNNKVSGPYLVVAPLSTLTNWMREFQKWTPDIPIILYHGSPQERQKKRTMLMRQDERLSVFPTVITSYEIIIRDRRYLEKYPWKYIVVDEGHRLKNLNCRLIRELKRYQSANRLLLTGTPLQNNLAELWSLLNFLLPDIFDDLDAFQRWFDFDDVYSESGDDRLLEKEQEDHIVSKLHQILKPFLLRRLKTDVEINIPSKKEFVLYASLSPLQKDYYTALIDKSDIRVLLSKEDSGQDLPEQSVEDRSNRRASSRRAKRAKQSSSTAPRKQNLLADVHVSMQNIVMQLRKCCNHPYLLKYPLTEKGEYKIDENLIEVSGKLKLLDRMLYRLRQNGHKVLIFSQMTRMLDILQDYCWLRSYPFCRLDGSVSFNERNEEIRRFHEDDSFLFLLSTRSGGLGLNLVAADTCIIFDSDWNPQVDLQAQDRCHRIGQTKAVCVYRLIISNSMDQRILERAEQKRKLERLGELLLAITLFSRFVAYIQYITVIHKGCFKGHSRQETQLSREDICALLLENNPAIPFQPEQEMSDQALDNVLRRENFESVKE